MKTETIFLSLTTIVIFALVISMGVLIIGKLEDTTASFPTQTDTLLTSSNESLSKTFYSTLSITAYNQTWLNLDGIDSYINVSDRDYFSINNETGDFTFSLWLKIPSWTFTGTDGTSGYIEAIGKGRTAWSNPEWGIRLYNSSNTANRPCRISFYVWNLTGGEGAGAYIQKNASSESCLPEITNTWFNLVGSVNESRVMLWVNGQKNTPSSGDLLDTYGIKGGMGNGDSAVRFGTRQITGFMNGSIDEIRIWNRTLTAGEISALNYSGRFQNISINSTNLVLWLRLNENTGTTAYDTSGLLNNGLIIGGASYGNDGITLTLTNATDYSISENTIIILNSVYSYSSLSASYLYETTVLNLLPYYQEIANYIPLLIVVMVGILVFFLLEKRNY